MLRFVRPRHGSSVGSLVYGVCLFLCGLFSYLYTTRFSGLPTPLLRHLDHAAIFLLIAGTYTPFATREILGPFKIRLLHWVWGIAFMGIILRLITEAGYDRIFVMLYVGMGWIFLTAMRDVIRYISGFALTFLALGAVIYSMGAIIFTLNLTDWTDPIWHSCVIGAATLHFIAVLSLLTRKQADTMTL
jgi:hemolysin III